ncbi:class I SAM-dependent methyltransferase [Humitalea rosea]|nr:FkbM family methyltransferase [Humitalea rosea]
MLLRVLGHVKNGFYIESGRFEANFLSMSDILYGRGWRGLSLAGDPAACRATMREPPLDTTLAGMAATQGAEALTLAQACATRHREGPIHLLRIDATSDVLAGLDLIHCRPWVVLAEAWQAPSLPAWEPLLTSQGYRFLGSSGARRMYLAEEHAELAEATAGRGPHAGPGRAGRRIAGNP